MSDTHFALKMMFLVACMSTCSSLKTPSASLFFERTIFNTFSKWFHICFMKHMPTNPSCTFNPKELAQKGKKTFKIFDWKKTNFLENSLNTCHKSLHWSNNHGFSLSLKKWQKQLIATISLRRFEKKANKTFVSKLKSVQPRP